MLLPALAAVGVFSYVPLYGVQLAFREYDITKGLTGGEFVGLEYFRQFVRDPMFTRILANTVRISLWTLVMGFFAPLLLALLINQIASPRVKSVVQTITYTPHFISAVVMVSMITIFLAPGTGLVGKLTGGSNLMGDPDAFATVYWVSEIWQHAGWNCIIYLAARD